MKVGIYQFAVAENLQENMRHIKTAVSEATLKGVELLLLPECALTGYPKSNRFTVKEIDFEEVDHAMRTLEKLSEENHLSIVAGTAEYSGGKYYNSAVLTMPGKKTYTLYRKRALWGWDADNFSPGDISDGIFEICGFRFGIRICFEIRFPEYFRELYRKNIDCAVVMFNDNSEEDSLERYDLIKSHVQTRAVENIFPVICVNNASRNQTAPTAVIDQEGAVISELPRHKECLLIYDLEKINEFSFGAKGRKYISDKLI